MTTLKNETVKANAINVINSTTDKQRANGRYNDFVPVDALEVEVSDNTTIKSRVSHETKETANDLEKPLLKNEVFAKVKNLFTPTGVAFDDSKIRQSMEPVVKSGLLPSSALEAAVSTARKEFENANREILEAAENISFTTFLEKLKGNKELYQNVCNVCKVNEIDAKMIFDAEGDILIYHYKDGDGYSSDNLKKKNVLGKEFTETVYFEKITDIKVSKYINALASYSIFQNAQKKLLNACKDSEKVLHDAIKLIKKALEEGFRLEDITSAL